MQTAKALLSILVAVLVLSAHAQQQFDSTAAPEPNGVGVAPTPNGTTRTRGCWEPDPGRNLTEPQINQKASDLGAKLQLHFSQMIDWYKLKSIMKRRPIDLMVNDVSELQKLPSDERTKKILEGLNERHEAIEARRISLNHFYGLLSPEQKKVFDAGIPYPWTLCIKE